MSFVLWVMFCIFAQFENSIYCVLDELANSHFGLITIQRPNH